MEGNQRAIFQTSVNIALVVLLLLTGACSTKPYVLKETDIQVPEAKEVFVVRRAWHTGFIIPSGTIQSQLPQLRERYGNTPYLEFGWGDKVYYEAEETNFGLTIKAIAWPTESVVQTEALPERPETDSANYDVEVLCLDNKQYALLINFIQNSFYQDSDSNIVETKRGTKGNSQFYQGQGEYHLMNTCNNWTAKGLRTAGLDISLAFKTTAGSVMGYLSRQSESLPVGLCGSLKP